MEGLFPFAEVVLGKDCGIGASLAVLHLHLRAVVIVLTAFSVEVWVFEVDQSLGEAFSLAGVLAMGWALLAYVKRLFHIQLFFAFLVLQ
jgi:hypothetical protein